MIKTPQQQEALLLLEGEEREAAERRRQLLLGLLVETAKNDIPAKIAENNRRFLNYFEKEFLAGRGPHGDWQVPSQSQQLAVYQKVIDARAMAEWTELQKGYQGEKIVFASPVAGNVVVTSPFGHRCATGCSGNHPGADLAVPGGGSPNIVAAADGVVLFVGSYGGYGNAAIIGHADGTQTLYAHMANGSLVPKMGARIKQGDEIGIMGTTGKSTGVHLHFEHRDGGKAIPPTIAGMQLTRNRQVAAGEGAGQTVVATKERPEPEQSTKLAVQDVATAASPSSTPMLVASSAVAELAL